MREWFFREKSYKKLLSKLIDESANSRGLISRIADAIGCQRSYLSQVLHSKVQLTKDQAWNICQFFALSKEETRYFECLVDHERAVSPAYKKHLVGQMEAIKADAGKISKRFAESTGFSEIEAQSYYSGWLPCALHILSSIPEFQDAQKMADLLGVGLRATQKSLASLQHLGLVKLNRGRWEFAGSSKFLPKGSPHLSFHHQNWRLKAVDHAREGRDDGLHYTMVQSLSAEDFELLKSLILEFIAKTAKIADPSKPEVLTALNLDFFQPGEG